MIAVALALSCSALVVAWLVRHPGIAPCDRPNRRSLHERPVPRAGGWAIFGGWAAALPFAGPFAGIPEAATASLLATVAVLFCLSLVDDYRGVGALVRLVVQAVCAVALAVAMGPSLGWGNATIAAATFVLVAVTNFFNFMDGSDGLAGTMAVCGFGAYAAASALAGAPSLPWVALVCAVVPFLARNLPPARLFLGDAGSVPLGFLAGAVGVAGSAGGAWPAWFPVLVFLPFLADATVTLLRRLLRGERVWEPHRSHYYQRLVRMGAGHRGTLRVYGGLMLGCAASAVACAAVAPAAGWALVAVWTAIIAAVFARIDYHVPFPG